MTSGGFRWLQVASGGFRWLQVASGGFRWLQVASGGFRWLQVASGGFRWLQVASGGFRWHFPILSRDPNLSTKTIRSSGEAAGFWKERWLRMGNQHGILKTDHMARRKKWNSKYPERGTYADKG